MIDMLCGRLAGLSARAEGSGYCAPAAAGGATLDNSPHSPSAAEPSQSAFFVRAMLYASFFIR